MQPFQRQLSLAVLLILVLAALPVARPAYAQTIIVTTLADSGAGSLREAINTANTNGAADTITFSVTGTIALTTALPDLTEGATTIDATSAGHAVVLDGSVVGAANGLTIRSSNNTIRGLVIVNFGNSGSAHSYSNGGIYITGSGNALYGNWIGIDPAGLPRGNFSYGIFLGDGASNNIIGADTDSDRNVITGNLAGGVYLGSATSGQYQNNNSIVGNYIGLTQDGRSVPTGLNILYITAGIVVSDGSSGTKISQNVIGGFLPRSAVLDVAGIQVTGATVDSMIPTSTTITGNYIGVSKDGVAIANGGNGVGIKLGSLGDCGPNGTTIGGTDSVARNIIANNTVYGRLLASLLRLRANGKF